MGYSEKLFAIYKKDLNLKINRGLNFKDEFANDLDDFNVWFNQDEFAAWHDINGERVLCVFVKDKRNSVFNVILGDAENPDGVLKAGRILFIRAQEIEGVKAGQYMTVDGALYLVKDSKLLQGQVWRLDLEANES